MIGLKIVDDLLNRSFYKLGLVVGRHPGYFLVIPVLLTLLGLTGFQRLHRNTDPEYLFTPINGNGKLERATVESFFKMNYSSMFDAQRITRAGRFGRVIITAKDGSTNILRSEIWKEIRLLDNMIQSVTVHHNFKHLTYKDICAKWMTECFQNNILNLDHLMESVESGALNLTFPIVINPFTLDIHVLPVFFGGTKVNKEGIIVSVSSVQLAYFGNVDTPELDKLGGAWEVAFLDTIGGAQDDGVFKHIRIARFTSRTLDHELEKNTRSVIPYFTSTFVIMAIFSVVTCMMTDWVRSKPWLGLLGNVSAGMATLCAFGVCMYAGVDFIGLCLAVPFLMIGIGIDDTFVMLAAWRRTSVKTPVPERMAQMLSEAAVSVTITSLTDFLSFWIGVFSPFPSVTIFCIYTGAATLFLFVWHVTFFAGCVAISGYCEQKNRHSIICINVEPLSKSQNRCCLYRALCSGGVDPADIDHPVDNQEHGFMVFFRDEFANFLNNSLVKIMIILIFGLYLLGAGYGVTQIQDGLDRRKVIKNDSYAIEFFEREDDYYKEFPYRIQVVVSGQYDYADPEIQRKVEHLTQTFENTPYIYGMYTRSWLRDYVMYAQMNRDRSNVATKTKEGFHKALKEFLLLSSDNLSLDVKFDDEGENIIAMRYLIQAVNISGTEHEKEMVQALRKICRESSLNVTVFNPYFVFVDQFELVRPVSIQNIIMGAAIMMVVSLIFIPNFLCSLWVAFSIVFIEIGVIGYMALWGVNLDSISMISLIMCIGFSVDFTAHICYAYMSSSAKSSQEKIRESLYALGLPIFQGAVSTILGMIGLLLANNYIFSVFFKMVFMVVFFGAMHGLFLLPVLLSLFGPGSYTSKDEDDVTMSNVGKALPNPYCIPHLQLKLNESNLGNNLKGLNLATLQNNLDKTASWYLNYRDLDKDLGLGTSEEVSSDFNSFHSNKNQTSMHEESIERRNYGVSWIRNPDNIAFSQLYGNQVLDNFGNGAELEYDKMQNRVEGNSRTFYDIPGPSSRNESLFRFNESKHRRYLDERSIERRYRDNWIRDPDEIVLSQLYANQGLDILGNNSELEYYKWKKRIKENRKTFYEIPRPSPRNESERGTYYPPEQKFLEYMNGSSVLARSSSYQTILNPRYMQKWSFP